jgi:hypothetical protein
MTDGWKGLEDIENQKIESLGLSDDEVMIAQAFKGEKGAKALEALRRITIEKPSFQSMYTDGVNTAIGMALREGENNLYRKILLIIKKVDSHGSRKSK